MAKVCDREQSRGMRQDARKRAGPAYSLCNTLRRTVSHRDFLNPFQG